MREVIGWLVFVLTVCLLTPGAVQAQLGADDEEKEEEGKVKMPVEFRIGGHAGAMTGEALSGEKERGIFGAVIVVNPKVWPVLFSSSADFTTNDPGDNYNISLNIATEFGLSDQVFVPYIGLGSTFFSYTYTERRGPLGGYFERSDGFAFNLMGGARLSLGIVDPFMHVDTFFGDDDTFYGIEGGFFLTF